MIRYERVILAVPLIALRVTGCGGGFSASKLPSAVTSLSVKPASITVDAGSTTTFMGVFAPISPAGGSLTWSIAPVDGGTITDAGVYTASSTAGQYTILATWTPPNSTAAVILKGLANVAILAVPQLDSVISPDQVQASGANQTPGAIQNGAIVGQGIPAVLAIDSSGDIQVRSGFAVPAAYPGSDTVCQ
jgi:hypothetical protein